MLAICRNLIAATRVSLKIDINFNRLSSEEKEKFFRLIQTAPWLEAIDFSGCCLHDSGVSMLVNSLSLHCHLTSLNLSGNHLSDAGPVLALKLPLEQLDLGCNNLTDEAFNLFYDDPPQEATLKGLVLDNNQLPAPFRKKFSQCH